MLKGMPTLKGPSKIPTVNFTASASETSLILRVFKLDQLGKMAMIQIAEHKEEVQAIEISKDREQGILSLFLYL